MKYTRSWFLRQHASSAIKDGLTIGEHAFNGNRRDAVASRVERVTNLFEGASPRLACGRQNEQKVVLTKFMHDLHPHRL
jgi:hypothetical protein